MRNEGLFHNTAVIVSCFQKVHKLPGNHREIDEFLRWARGFGSLVIWTHLAFRPGYPEISEETKSMGEWVTKRWFRQHAPNVNISDFLLPMGPDDRILRAVRNNAFVGTDLELLLKGQQIQTVIVLGYGMETMVLQTALHAAELNYPVCVVRDACYAQSNFEGFVETAVMEKVLPMSTIVSTMQNLKKDMVWSYLETSVEYLAEWERGARTTEEIRQEVIQHIHQLDSWMVPLLP